MLSPNHCLPRLRSHLQAPRGDHGRTGPGLSAAHPFPLGAVPAGGPSHAPRKGLSTPEGLGVTLMQNITLTQLRAGWSQAGLGPGGMSKRCWHFQLSGKRLESEIRGVCHSSPSAGQPKAQWCLHQCLLRQHSPRGLGTVGKNCSSEASRGQTAVSSLSYSHASPAGV